ncbi:hypothetical protein HAX54_012846, partial [Datura stramonium]|nr:hypothetical protein [Datura stramonium]
MPPENWIDEGHLAQEFPAIRKNIHELGAGYIFNKSKRCNLTLVRKFYANWDTSFKKSIKVKIRGKVVRITAKMFNALLETPAVDPSQYFILLEKPPYRGTRNTLC